MSQDDGVGSFSVVIKYTEKIVQFRWKRQMMIPYDGLCIFLKPKDHKASIYFKLLAGDKGNHMTR